MPKRKSKIKSTRYLTTDRSGEWFYWTPPSKLRNRSTPEWIKSTPLGKNVNVAIAVACELNDKLDRWREGQKPKGGFDAMVISYLGSPAFRDLADRTKADYGKHIKELRAMFGEFAASDITPAIASNYHDALHQGGISRRWISYRMQVLRRLYSWGIRRGYARINPASNMELSTKRTNIRRIWTSDQLQEAINLPYPCGAAALAALYSVQRQGDILAMPRSVGIMEITQRKTGQQVWLPIHRHWREGIGQHSLLIHTKRAAAYTSDGFRAVWGRTVKGRGWPTFHAIRATAISLLKAHGLTDGEVMLWTGHKRDSNKIMDVYDMRIQDRDAWAKKSFAIMDGWPRVQTGAK